MSRPLLRLALAAPACGPVESPNAGQAEETANTGDARAPTVYVVERYAGHLYAVDRATGETRWTRDDLSPTVGLAVDREGFIYLGVTDTDDVGSLARLSPDGAELDVLIPPDGTFLRPQGLWYDAFTNTLLLADVNAATVYEVDLDSRDLSVITAEVPEPSDAARRPGQDTVYVSSRSEGRVYAISPGAGEPAPFAGEVPDAHSLVPGADGLLYAMATGLNALVALDEASGAVTVLARDFSSAPAVGLCLDALPDGLLVGDHAGATLHLYDVITGVVTPFFTASADLYECGHNAPPDQDTDGWISVTHAGPDCDDGDPDVFPGQGC